MVEKTKTFAERFEDLRAGMSFQALADAIYRKSGIRVSAQAMHKWSKGGGIEQDKVKLLADFFGVSEAWLIYGEGSQIAKPSLHEALGALPDESRQQVLDFIEYKIERAEGIIASDKVADYVRMIDAFRDDLARRRASEKKKPEG